ncbi:hypothetical protein C4559_04150 [Candidatus Microgenomates bacterium]|nr:MAG: hypothetical protein C4559_04150 [Candidatus Microgenomates bacterium]
MKRILLSAVILTISLSVAVMSTWAAWTSSVTVNNNVITTGSVDLNVSLNGTAYSNSVDSTTAISSLMPGNVRIGTQFYVRNDSSTGINFNLRATGAATVSGTTPPADLTSLQIAVVPHGTAAVDADYHTLAQWGSNQTLGTLNAGASSSYDIVTRLNAAAADDWQGRTVNFTLTVTGEQQ